MNTINTNNAERQSFALPGSGPFDERQWFNYFERNRDVRSIIELPNKIVLPDAISKPLLHSLQRFQIGETGEGKHLKKYASKYGSKVYAECVDLFIKEEQGHGQILAEVIMALNGTLIRWHWTDSCFIFMRRLLHLKTELMLMIVAEIIGKIFYRIVADKISKQSLSNTFAILVCDEIAHLRFHAEFLQQQMRHYPQWLKSVIHFFWSMIFYTACLVFVTDHKQTLRALDVTDHEFISLASRDFNRASLCAFAAD